MRRPEKSIGELDVTSRFRAELLQLAVCQFPSLSLEGYRPGLAETIRRSVVGEGGFASSRRIRERAPVVGLACPFGLIALRNAVIGRFLWAGFALAIIAIALVPAVVTRNWSAIITWEAFFLAAIPILAQLGGVFVEPLTCLSVATLALQIAVHLVSFSEVRMPPWFAVAFVITTAMTVAAGWAVVQYYTGAILGTSYIPSRAELMWDFVGSIAGGLLAGFVFVAVFAVAVGVLWEVVEFGLERVSAILGGEPLVAQYSLADVMLDLQFDIVGGIILALW